jgi:hypothetical protein
MFIITVLLTNNQSGTSALSTKTLLKKSYHPLDNALISK